MGEPGGLLSMGLHRVGHDWSDLAAVVEGINSRLDDTMEWISKIEERAAEITQPEQKKKTERENVSNEDSLRELWDNIKDTDTHSIGVPEGEERRKELETIFEDIIAENFPNTGKEKMSRSRKHRQP